MTRHRVGRVVSVLVKSSSSCVVCREDTAITPVLAPTKHFFVLLLVRHLGCWQSVLPRRLTGGRRLHSSLHWNLEFLPSGYLEIFSVLENKIFSLYLFIQISNPEFQGEFLSNKLHPTLWLQPIISSPGVKKRFSILFSQ